MSRTMSKKHLLAGLAAAGVLGVGIAAAPAFAEDSAAPTPSASSSADQGGTDDQGTDRQQQRADRQAEFAEALAKELGVPIEKVTTALEKLRAEHEADRPQRPSAEDRQAMLKQRLDQAVKDGKLTQEQADAITKAVESGVFPGGGMGFRGHHMR
ncbi:hypothetical protein [Micromonospora siamensis]|uniref:Uncharacterized protein n=1 Tax=Micromonospora siamensis TaxID=299152 RepID=A0A1C5JPS3_9ACTN|nr:hypothetical protein [Micromonospora siamensis]SCG72006.1 hypothetical protein GA0074704_4706 [Micromonospora siamensis]